MKKITIILFLLILLGCNKNVNKIENSIEPQNIKNLQENNNLESDSNNGVNLEKTIYQNLFGILNYEGKNNFDCSQLKEISTKFDYISKCEGEKKIISKKLEESTRLFAPCENYVKNMIKDYGLSGDKYTGLYNYEVVNCKLQLVLASEKKDCSMLIAEEEKKCFNILEMIKNQQKLNIKK